MTESFSGAYELETDDGQDCRRSTCITVNLAAIRANLATARRLSAGSKLFATVKADAYGHGAVAVAQALSARRAEHGLGAEKAQGLNESLADGFAVVSLGEAVELRQAGIEQPVLVLQGPSSRQALAEMQQLGLWPVIHDKEQYAWLRQSSLKQSTNAWLKVDTGMGRLGFQVNEATAMMSASEGIRWQGLMTHYACADELDNRYTETQLARFNGVVCPKHVVRSSANSAAVLAWPQTRADWARPGLMLYGCNPLDRPLPNGVELIPAMTVKAPLVAVKVLPSGAGIGYAQTWHCPEEMPVGYVALGYRDGIPRVLDKSAAVYITGVRCPIIGRVSMDSFAVDLRAVPEASMGSYAELWGMDASIDHLAQSAGTISYELLTSIRGHRNYITDA